MRSKSENIALAGILMAFAILTFGSVFEITFGQASWIDYFAFTIMAFSIGLIAVHEVRTGNASFLGVTFKAAIQNTPIKTIYVPTRKADRKRWHETWLVIKPLVSTGYQTDQDTLVFLENHYVELACHYDTLKKIIAAGEAGLLD